MPQPRTAQESLRAAWDTPLLWLQQPRTSPRNHSEGCPEYGLRLERVSDGTLQRVLKKLSHHHRHHPLPPDDAASPGARSGRVSQNHIQNYLNCIVPKIVQGACPHCGKVGVVGRRGNGRAATELPGTRSGRASQNHIQNYLNCIVFKIVQGACPHCGKVGVVGQRGNGRAAT